VNLEHGPLRVSDNRRFLVHRDGTPFFYLGDTVWELFHRLGRAEVDRYLANRAAKRFTVCQAVILSEMDGLTAPNANGDLPLHDLDPARPNEAYFQHVDYVVDRAAEAGIFMGLLPTWGSWVVDEEHPLFEEHRIFDAPKAETYGRFLGDRYGDRRNVIWILGGDRVPEGYEDVWRALARGIAVGTSGREDYGRTLMTFHPRGGHSSGEHFQAEPWLSFGMVQSGHSRHSKPHQMIAREYCREPIKPVINGEPAYERIPEGLERGAEKLDEHDVRRFAYWSVFAGACGHTYGANEMWMMWSPEIEPTNPVVSPLLDADTPWWEAMDYPGAGQMQHLRALMESRPARMRIPDQGLLASEPGEGLTHVRATRCGEGSYAMVYVPASSSGTDVHVGRLEGDELVAWWFDPRTGEAERVRQKVPARGISHFVTPEASHGWVLVLDDASRGFPPPGSQEAV
jgi:hypothetical protein